MINLDQPLRDRLKPPFTEEQVEDICQRIEESSTSKYAQNSIEFPRRSGPKRWHLVAFAAILLISIGVLFFLLRTPVFEGESQPTEQTTQSQVDGPIRILGGDQLRTIAHPEDADMSARFGLDDGSTIRLSAGARLDTRVNRTDRVELDLRSGEVSFDIPSGGPRSWLIRAGQVEVEVVGTVFSVQRQPNITTVAVTRGTVIVRSEELASRHHTLRTGERLILSHGPTPETLVAEQSPEQTDESSQSTEETSPQRENSNEASEQHTQITSPAESWQELARQRRFREAYRALGPLGIRGAVDSASDVGELFLLADVAKLSGHQTEAILPLERIINHHPTDHRAGLAAFTLGRIQLRALRQPEAASQSFGRALRLGLPPSLREDAQARIVEARRLAGQYDAARRAAQEYFRRYPSGRMTDEVRRWSGGDEK